MSSGCGLAPCGQKKDCEQYEAREVLTIMQAVFAQNIPGLFLLIILKQLEQLLFKSGDIAHTGAVNVISAQCLILMGGDVSHA